MAQYTDDERVDDLKKWWKENGASIIAGIALGLIAIFGWQYWNSYRDAQAEKASLAYDGFVEAVEQPDVEQARQRGRTLLTDFPKSSYAVLTALHLARLELDDNDVATAAQHLEWVIANARLGEFKDIARLRLARARFAAGQPAEAKKLLEDVTTASLIAEREELKGDLYLADGDLAQARAAYTAALAVAGGAPLLQLKLDNLTPTTAESVVAAPPPPPAPSEPEESAETVEPGEPLETVEPGEPLETVEPGEPLETVEPGEPLETVEPGEPLETVEPGEPLETVEPGEPLETVEPGEPLETVEPGEPLETVEPGEPLETVEPGEPLETVEPGEPLETVEPGEPLETVEPGEPLETVEPGEPLETVEPGEPLETVEPGEPLETVEPGEPIEPATLPTVDGPEAAPAPTPSPPAPGQ